LDEIDRNILIALQKDASQSIDALAETVALSRNACWRRVKRLESDGVLKQRIALVDAAAVGLPMFRPMTDFISASFQRLPLPTSPPAL